MPSHSIVEAFQVINQQTATTLLQGAGGETKTAFVMSLLYVTAEAARQHLSTQNDRLRETLAALDPKSIGQEIK